MLVVFLVQEIQSAINQSLPTLPHQIIKEFAPVILHQQSKILQMSCRKTRTTHLKWLHKLDRAVYAKHIAAIVCALLVHEQVNSVELTWKA